MMATAGDLGKVMLDQVDENYVIFLEGDLGAGKTTFVKGFMKGMNFEEVVNSPTFSLIERIELQKHCIGLITSQNYLNWICTKNPIWISPQST